jgi:tRNA pseudouridine38-40 synthase
VPRIRLILAYTGTHYHGWQLQAHGPTVQGTVEAALERLVGVPTRVHGAGRTDAGVHAVGQVAHFDVAHEKRHIPWQRALNAVLPGDAAFKNGRPKPEDVLPDETETTTLTNEAGQVPGLTV